MEPEHSPKVRIEREVETTLHSLDRLERAELDSFFMTRLQAEIKRREGLESSRIRLFAGEWALRVAVPAALVALVALNVVSLYVYGRNGSLVNRQERAEQLQNVATAYSLSTSEEAY